MMKGSKNRIDGDFFGVRVKGTTFVIRWMNFQFYLA